MTTQPPPLYTAPSLSLSTLSADFPPLLWRSLRSAEAVDDGRLRPPTAGLEAALHRLTPAPPLLWLTLQQMNQLSANRPHNGIILDVEPLQTPLLDHLPPPPPASPSFAAAPLWLLLDEVQDVANVGSILRAAEFFGVQGLVLCRKNSAPLSPVASKASSGAMESLSLHSTSSTIRFLQRTRAEVGEDGAQWDIVGLSAADSRGEAVDCRLFRVERPTLLVVGNEGRGLRQLVLNECHRLLHIHPAPHTTPLLDSLNVGTALAIALYQCSIRT